MKDTGFISTDQFSIYLDGKEGHIDFGAPVASNTKSGNMSDMEYITGDMTSGEDFFGLNWRG